VVWVSLDAESMDEVEGHVHRHHHLRLMNSNEQITLDEALGRMRERVDAVPGDPWPAKNILRLCLIRPERCWPAVQR
jgi:hypothetical protein